MKQFPILMLIFSFSNSILFRCDDPSAKDEESFIKGFQIDEVTKICVHFIPLNIRYVFEVKVDRSVMLKIKGLLLKNSSENTDITTQMSNTDMLSNSMVK